MEFMIKIVLFKYYNVSMILVTLFTHFELVFLYLMSCCSILSTQVTVVFTLAHFIRG